MPLPGKKRARSISSDSESNWSDDGDSDSDSDYSAHKKPQKPKTPQTKAEISILATDTSSNAADAHHRVNNIDVAIIQKIKKALSLASHESTGEDEARAALRMASKLLERHNVTQADVMAQETDSEKIKRAGRSVVSVKCNPDRPITVNAEKWASSLSRAMCEFFDCRTYRKRFSTRALVDYHFYGLAEQTVAAAYAFEMAYNLIMVWSFGAKIASSIHAKNCYRKGVAHGLNALAKKEKEEEKAMAIQKEQALLEARKKDEDEDDKSRIKRLDDPGVNVKVEELVSVKKEEDVDVKLEDVKAELAVKIEEDEKSGCLPQVTQDGAGAKIGDGGKPQSNKAGVTMEEIEDEDMFRAPLNNDSFGQSGHTPSPTGNTFFNFDAPSDESDGDDNGSYPDNSELTTAPLTTGCSSTETDQTMPPPASTQPLVEQGKQDKSTDNPNFESPWDSGNQLVAFRETSLAIADDFLKSEGVKLKKSRKSHFRYTQQGAKFFAIGKTDARKIDVRRKRIKYVDDE